MTRTDVRDSLLGGTTDAIAWGPTLLVGVCVGLVATVGQWVVSAGVGLWIQPVGFAVVAAAIVAGRPARWGSASALLVVGSVAAGWSYGVAWAVAAFVAVAVSVRLWARDDRGREEGRIAWTLRYLVVAVAGVLVFAATSSCLLDVFGRAAFSVTVGRTVVASLPLAIVGAPLVGLTVERIGEHDGASSEPVTMATRAGVVLIALCWTVGGYAGSFVFRAIRQIPLGILGREFSPTVQRFVAIWGWQGTYAQFLLGLVSLVLIAFLLRR